MTRQDKSQIQQISADVLIIGGGAAGFTAGLYCARSGFKTLVLAGKGSSKLALGYQLENYPGFISIDSQELLKRFRKQAEHFGAEVLDADVIDINLSLESKFAATREHLIEARAVIIATGRPASKKSRIPGEEMLIGMGVSYCATCDGPLFRGKRVLAVGDTDEAAEDVLALHQMGVGVEWVTGGKNDLQVSGTLMEQVKKSNIPILSDARILEIKGDDRVEGVVIKQAEKETEQKIDGIFIFKEMPFTSLFSKSGLNFDHRQCVVTDRSQKTNLEGVFAAGDVTCGGMQVVTAAGEGAMAAMQTMRYLRKK